MRMKNGIILFKFVTWLVICQLPGLFGMSYVFNNMAWYRTLAHPPLTPPEASFGMVWGVLYILLGISAFLTFREKIHAHAMILFVGQLALNACWTPVFFGAHSLFGGLLLLVAMLVELGFLLAACRQINPTAAWLLVPYGLWLLFATYLTATTWWLN